MVPIFRMIAVMLFPLCVRRIGFANPVPIGNSTYSSNLNNLSGGITIGNGGGIA
jgi:hypothetical protein